jgi:hypothetical protein
LWRGAFIAPWDWRHRDKGTTILGPLSVPITAQKQLLEPVSAEGASSHDCIIKGNINREGEQIYHIPGGNSYAKINMDMPGKRWFCKKMRPRLPVGGRLSASYLPWSVSS